MRIRGPNSLNAGQEPLFVVDGRVVPFAGGDLGSMNPSTVESITVLKDAGSTAIYGSRGANGVILIKTKMGGGG
jgi:TonB-dependent SusC/RagA subfamily outer membrane receptor